MKFKKKPSKSRKLIRKEKRIAKKAKKHEFYCSQKQRGLQQRKKADSLVKSELVNKTSQSKPNTKNINFNNQTSSDKPAKQRKKRQKQKLSLQDEQKREIDQMERDHKKLEKEMKQTRIKQLKKDNNVDDIEIKKLEKLLKIKKKAEKTASKCFEADGLNFDVCDRSKLKNVADAKNQFAEDESDFDNDVAEVTGKSSKEKKGKKLNKSVDSDLPEEKPNKKSSSLKKKDALTNNQEETDESNLDSSSDFGLMSDEDMDDLSDDEENEEDSQMEASIDENEGSEGDELEAETSEHKSNSSRKRKLPADEDVEEDKTDGTWEDIYGRTRDKDGNVLNAYKPPHLRKATTEDGPENEKLVRLKKQMKGLLNRLAENNIASISSQVESLYMTNSRNDANETLWKLLRESLLTEIATPERLVAEHAMLLAILSANIGSEVFAYTLQKAVSRWHELWQTAPEIQDKESNNILLLLCYMFQFKLFHCTLLYDILEQLLNKLGEKEVELILTVLRTAGIALRKEDPTRLKDFVLRVQKLSNEGPSAAEGTRARFMMDTVLAIKNNNISKIPNYNPEYAERLKKALRTCIRKGNYNAELKITLEDLLKVDERGRWWVVGSAWTGVLPGEKQPEERNEKKSISKSPQEGFSSKLLELAKKQRMNTDTRRTIFCILLSSEDYLDAFEKLMKLGLKGPSEREIMNVLVHCLLAEKEYNPYYSHLARRICTCDRRFQIMLQFVLWDKIKEIQTLSTSNVSHLAKFLGFIVLEKSLPISVLKVVQFAELDKISVRFIRQVLLVILLADSEESSLAVFSRIASSKNLKLFREGLRLFLHHFVLKNCKTVTETDMVLLNQRVKLADSALSAADRSIKF